MLQKRVTNQLIGWEFCVVQQETFEPRQNNEPAIFYKKSVFLSLIGPSVTIKSQYFYNWFEIGIFQT